MKLFVEAFVSKLVPACGSDGSDAVRESKVNSTLCPQCGVISFSVSQWGSAASRSQWKAHSGRLSNQQALYQDS